MDFTYSIITEDKDIDFLMNRESFNYSYTSSTIDLLKRNFKLQDSCYLLVKSVEDFVGFCSTDRDWWERNYFFIREILVDRKFKNLGIGEKLMKQCIEHAKNKNAVGVVTETALDNILMRNLCSKLGFKEWDNPKWREGVTYKLLF